jgi:predicted DNA binding CopG/RHH family protein
MKKKYNFTKSKKRSERAPVLSSKIPTSIRLDGAIISWYKTEAERLGIPYQTLVSSVLHRFANSELIDKEEVLKLSSSKAV